MNDERSEWAGEAIQNFIDNTGTDREDALCDLLADIMHWCDRNDFEFGNELSRAEMHYEAETSENGGF